MCCVAVGRLQVTVCLEGDDARVLQELKSAGRNSPLALLRSCLLLCLEIR